MVGTAIIPQDYTDKDGDLIPGAEERVIKRGGTADIAGQFGGNAQTFDPRLNVSSEQSMESFRLATETYSKLSQKERAMTSVGALAVSINTMMANKNKPVVSAAESIVAETFNSQTPTPEQTVTRNKPPKTRSRIATKQEQPAVDFNRQIRRAMASLDIPGLDVVPGEPWIDVELRYTEESRPIAHKFKVHWATVMRDAYGQINKVTVTFDSRWGAFGFSPSQINFTGESMQVILNEAGEDTQSATVFEALRGCFVADVGVFHTVIFASL